MVQTQAQCDSSDVNRSIPGAKGGGIFGAMVAMVIEPGGRNIGMAHPFLHLGDVCPVLQSIGRCCGT